MATEQPMIFTLRPWCRVTVAAAFAATTLLVSACSHDEPAVAAAAIGSSAPASTAPIGSAGPAGAKHGGSLTRVGNHPVEVVTHASGQVYAYVEADVPSPATAEMDIEVPVRAGRRSVDMRWNAREARYEGRVQRDTIIEGPVSVAYVVGGIRLIAVIPIIVIAPAVQLVVIERDYHRHHGKHKHRGWH